MSLRASELLEVASDLLNAGYLTQSHVKRAISTSYYAVFSRLCELLADALCGEQGERPSESWIDVYRGVGHAVVGKLLKEGARKRKFGHAFAEFSQFFERLRNLRHDADYDPERVFLASEAQDHITMAMFALESLAATTPEERLAVAVALFVRPRDR